MIDQNSFGSSGLTGSNDYLMHNEGLMKFKNALSKVPNKSNFSELQKSIMTVQIKDRPYMFSERVAILQGKKGTTFSTEDLKEIISRDFQLFQSIYERSVGKKASIDQLITYLPNTLSLNLDNAAHYHSAQTDQKAKESLNKMSKDDFVDLKDEKGNSYKGNEKILKEEKKLNARGYSKSEAAIREIIRAVSPTLSGVTNATSALTGFDPYGFLSNRSLFANSEDRVKITGSADKNVLFEAIPDILMSIARLTDNRALNIAASASPMVSKMINNTISRGNPLSYTEKGKVDWVDLLISAIPLVYEIFGRHQVNRLTHNMFNQFSNASSQIADSYNNMYDNGPTMQQAQMYGGARRPIKQPGSF